MFLIFRVIHGEYIKIPRGIVKLVYEVKPFGLLEAWHKFLAPYRWNRGGDYRFPRRLSVSQSVLMSVRPSVRLSVCLSVHSVSVQSVFRTSLCRLLRYWLEIWYMNLSWHNTDQVRVWSLLTYFYRSYCPLLKLSFPNFSLPSFEILTWNLIYEFVLT